MLSRDLEKAKQAYQSQSVEEMKLAHQAVRPSEEHKQAQGQYLKSIVYGGLDGSVTTFAVVAGVAGAQLSAGVVLIMGFANLVADGLSMAVGDYLSTKAEQEYNRAERAREEWEVTHYPEGEQQELVELYTAKGVPPEDARAMVKTLAKHRKAWVDVMMVEELGIIESEESPLKSAVATFCSFALFGFVPLVAFVAAKLFPALRVDEFPAACALTGVTLFGLGAMKVRFTGKGILRSGFETLLVGGLAAAAAYGVGVALSHMGISGG